MNYHCYLLGGSVRLNASDPLGDPIINPNLLAHDFDMFVMREALLSARHFLTAPVWNDYVISPFVNATTDEEIDSFIRNNTRTIFHPVGTASMTPADAGYGVVNPDLKVKGAEGLRIVDASILVSASCFWMSLLLDWY
jgi:choline dehydrogenase-like flavoprotein